MAVIPFRTSPRRVAHTLELLSSEMWTCAGDILDYLGKFEMNSWEDISTTVDIPTLERLFWELYGALAHCPISRDGIYDLALLSACTLPGNKSDHVGRFPAYSQHGQNLEIRISSLRQDNQIPENIGDLIEFAKSAAHYTSGGNVPLAMAPKSASSALGRFLYKQFIRSTSEVYPLDLADQVELIRNLSLPFMLLTNLETRSEYHDSKEAVAALSDFVRNY